MPFILKEMVQSMMCTSFSGKEDICTNNSTFTDKRQLTENGHDGKKIIFVIILLTVDDFMKCYNVRNFKCAFKESF